MVRNSSTPAEATSRIVSEHAESSAQTRDTGALAWWLTRAALPIAILSAGAVLLAQSDFDRASLQPFFEQQTQSFPLREDWFFAHVLHGLGKYAIITLTVVLGIGALVGWRTARWRWRARACAYLVACYLATIAITALWKQFAGQIEPWNTIGFGGDQPWPVPLRGASFVQLVGSPGAHAASGFAWIALYFVGASVGTRYRWLWLTPGLLLGLLFVLGQHARGAHQPSHELWSIAVAWSVACACAVLFRRWDWLAWDEVAEAAEAKVLQHETAIPWLVGASIGCCGVGFFALDKLTEYLDRLSPSLHRHFEYLELTITAVGFGVGAWLLAEKFSTMRARESARLEAERERRFQLLGRLAASVAHEVRNPLHTVRLIVDEQRHDVPGLREHALIPEFEASLERIDRAVDLVYRLARPENVEAGSVDLAQAARESIVALSRTYAGRVRFEWRREPQRAIVSSSNTALRIVLDNLLRNAAEAAPDAATIVLELESEGADWLLRIHNPGTLDERSKPGKGGLGLGIAISRQIASSAGGSIDLSSSDGGVTCTLRWPRAT